MPLYYAGGFNISAARTSTPWALPGVQVLVLPVGPDGTMNGSLARSFMQVCSQPSRVKLDEAALEFSRQVHMLGYPHLVHLNDKNTGLKAAVVSTAFGEGGYTTPARAALGALAAVRLACAQNLDHVALPILGTGGTVHSTGPEKLDFARAIIGALLDQMSDVAVDVVIVDKELHPEDTARLVAEHQARSGKAAPGGPAAKEGLGSGLKLGREASEAETALNSADYTATLTKLFVVAEPDFTFGLYGPWGRGKSFLMRRVGERLEKDHGYRTIRFSAWAYPDPPMLWAYLYERIAECARSSNGLVGWAAISLRTQILRHGWAPASLSMLIFGVAVLPLSAWWAFVVSVYGIVGLLGVMFMFRITRNGSALIGRLGQYAAIERHSDKLGLQAVIGRDLQSLLLAWMPVGPGDQSLRRRVKGAGQWLFLLTCLFSTTALTPWSQRVLQPLAPSSAPADGLGHYWLSWGVAGVWFGFSLGIWLLATRWLRREHTPERLLLIVDDLDRCEPGKMLNIVENLKVFLENAGVSERMQIAMLLDEEMLGRALRIKYGRAPSEAVDEVFDPRGSVEKLFVVFLRMPLLSGDDLQMLLDRYFKTHSRPEPALRAPRTDVELDSLGAAQTKEAAIEEVFENILGPLDRSSATSSPQEPFTDVEKVAFREIIGRLAVQSQGRLGPRSVRCFLFRYQLARLLLTRVHNRRCEPMAILQALAHVDYQLPVTWPMEAADMKLLTSVTHQVSLTGDGYNAPLADSGAGRGR